jgi:UDPglucose 6-dehydrogenase
LSEKGFKVHVFDKMKIVPPGGIDTLGHVQSTNNLNKEWSVGNFVDAVELIRVCDESDGTLCKVVENKEFSGVYFVCVPTPMNEDGSCDTSIVEGVLDSLAESPRRGKHDRIVVIKSTVPPGSTAKWNKKYGERLRVIFSPEFLTEANALDDMRNQNRIVLGGPRPWINKAKLVFQAAFPSVPIIKTSSTTAEMVKYVTNCFLATKVSFANEVQQICSALDSNGLDIDYDKVIEYATKDVRLGTSHWQVPGPDGEYGFGKTCFPKDLNALSAVARELNITPCVMDGVWSKNLEVRKGKSRDWESMVGRAVTKMLKGDN